MKKYFLIFLWLLLLTSPAAQVQVPQLMSYQGRIQVGTENFDGIGQFKFALVQLGTGAIYWSNDGVITGPQTVPSVSVPIRVTKGLYSVVLGDTSLPNMAALPATAFAGSDLFLRIWFNNGTSGFQLLAPDQRITSAGYAFVAATVPNGSITAEKLAPGVIPTLPPPPPAPDPTFSGDGHFDDNTGIDVEISGFGEIELFRIRFLGISANIRETFPSLSSRTIDALQGPPIQFTVVRAFATVQDLKNSPFADWFNKTRAMQPGTARTLIIKPHLGLGEVTIPGCRPVEYSIDLENERLVETLTLRALELH